MAEIFDKPQKTSEEKQDYRIFSLFCSLLLSADHLQPQKHFYLTAEFPSGINVGKVGVWLNDVNGSEKNPPISTKENRLVSEANTTPLML